MTDAAPLIDETSGLQEFDLRYYNAGYYTPMVKRNGTVEEVGNSVPDFLGSINTTLRWKNWTLSASFDGRFGGKVASYGSHYGNAYGYTKASLEGREGHGGIHFKSGFDGYEYDDGIIPNGIVTTGTQIVQPDGSMYTVGTGQYSSGETWAELVAAGHAEYVHAGGWHYFYNSWGQAVVNDTWFKTLNYIAFRDLSLSYQFESNIANKIGAKRLSLTAQAHNLGYLLNTMPNHENPEAVAGTTAAEFRIRQFAGVTTSFTFTLKATF
jgi:iron complex outermembrane receptor protein